MHVIIVSNNNQKANIDFYRERDHKEVKEQNQLDREKKTGRN